MASTEILHKKVDILMKLRGYRRVGEEKGKGEGVTDITVVKRGTKKKLPMRIVTKSKLISGNIGVKQIKEMEETLEQMDVEGGILIERGFSFAAKQRARKAHIEILSARSLEEPWVSRFAFGWTSLCSESEGATPLTSGSG